MRMESNWHASLTFCFFFPPDASSSSYSESLSPANARPQFPQVPKMLKMVEHVKGAFKGMKKIPKATVFGVPFLVAAQDAVDGIPMLIKRCVAEIDNRGIAVKVLISAKALTQIFWIWKFEFSGYLSREWCEKSYRKDMLLTGLTTMCPCWLVRAVSSRYKRCSQILFTSITRATGPSRFLRTFYRGCKGNYNFHTNLWRMCPLSIMLGSWSTST